MLWNTLIHAVLGVLGRNAFAWSLQGTAGAVGIAAVVQGIDMIRVYRYHNGRFLASPAGQSEDEIRAFRQGLKIKLPQLYILKILWYASITLLSAAVSRALM